jgi:hypothetical protein
MPTAVVAAAVVVAAATVPMQCIFHQILPCIHHSRSPSQFQKNSLSDYNLETKGCFNRQIMFLILGGKMRILRFIVRHFYTEFWSYTDSYTVLSCPEKKGQLCHKVHTLALC